MTNTHCTLNESRGRSSLLMCAHMQDEIVFMLALLVANWTLKLGLHSTLESDVSIQTVRPGIRVATPMTRICSSGSSLIRSTNYISTTRWTTCQATGSCHCSRAWRHTNISQSWYSGRSGRHATSGSCRRRTCRTRLVRSPGDADKSFS